MPAKKTTKKATKKPAAKKVAKKTVQKPAAKKKAPAKRAAAKKAVSKKSATKKSASKKVTKAAPKKCACHKTCKDEECFWVNNGPVVDSLKGLKTAMKDMTVAQYEYHAKGTTNDFACWIRDCIGDKACAARVARAKNKNDAVKGLCAKCA